MTAEAGQTEQLFFDEHQWRTIEAAMARIIPTDRDPGAREASTVTFLDRYLSGIDYVYAQPDGSGFLPLSGKLAEVWHRRIQRLRQKYVEGIAELDDQSRNHAGAAFVDLSAAQQDRILEMMARPEQGQTEMMEEAGVTAGFEVPEAGMQQVVSEHALDFFPLLVLHTRQGFYSDPVYGGNRDHVGWKTIGFPGPESMAETHQGRYSTLPYFAEENLDGHKGQTP